MKYLKWQTYRDEKGYENIDLMILKLKNRLAEGEISKEEYFELLKIIES